MIFFSVNVTKMLDQNTLFKMKTDNLLLEFRFVILIHCSVPHFLVRLKLIRSGCYNYILPQELALLALGGDIGCSGGPTLVGMVSGAFGDNLKMGILAGIIFPVLLLIGVILCRRQKKITNYNTVKSRH